MAGTPLRDDGAVETVIIAVVAGTVVGALLAVAGRHQGRADRSPRAPSTSDQPAAPLDLAAVTEAVRATVQAEMLQTAQQALAEHRQQAHDLFEARSASVHHETKALLTPVSDEMRQLRAVVDQLRSSVHHDQGAIRGMAEALSRQVTELTASTQALDGALRSSSARGSWGEHQLRNVIELAGMAPYCDYLEQPTVNHAGAAERVQRPDVVVRLPNGAFVAVDAKAPMAAYLRAQECTDHGVRDAQMRQHARAIADHVKVLADRRYWEQFPTAPDFVVLFVPGESFLAEALRADPNLLDQAMRQRVLVASPVNLLALLLAVARGWQAFSIAEHADNVAALGKELYDRVGTMLTAVSAMGRGLDQATKGYSDMVGSLEGRVLVSLRRFRELGVTSDELPDVHQLQRARRHLTAPEVASVAAD